MEILFNFTVTTPSGESLTQTHKDFMSEGFERGPRILETLNKLYNPNGGTLVVDSIDILRRGFWHEIYIRKNLPVGDRREIRIHYEIYDFVSGEFVRESFEDFNIPQNVHENIDYHMDLRSKYGSPGEIILIKSIEDLQDGEIYPEEPSE